jgi:hypothetical protein
MWCLIGGTSTVCGKVSTEFVEVTYDGDLTEGTTGVGTRRMGRRNVVMPWSVAR